MLGVHGLPFLGGGPLKLRFGSLTPAQVALSRLVGVVRPCLGVEVLMATSLSVGLRSFADQVNLTLPEGERKDADFVGRLVTFLENVCEVRLALQVAWGRMVPLGWMQVTTPRELYLFSPKALPDSAWICASSLWQSRCSRSCSGVSVAKRNFLRMFAREVNRLVDLVWQLRVERTMRAHFVCLDCAGAPRPRVGRHSECQGGSGEK